MFYELAIRHAIRKPIIQIISKGESIPFDVAGTRTIFVDHHDLDSVESAKSSILQQVDSLETDASDLETPISVSLDLQRLRQSENPEQRSLADIVSALSGIRNGLSTLEERLMVNLHDQMLGRETHLLVKELSDSVDRTLMHSQHERKQRIDPSAIRRMIHYLGRGAYINLVLPVVLGPFREDAPWLYEVGMKLYEELETDNMSRTQETVERLVYLSNLTRDSIDSRPELNALLDELMDFLQMTLPKSRYDSGQFLPPELRSRLPLQPTSEEESPF